MESQSVEASVWLPGRMKHVFNEFGKSESVECNVCDTILLLQKNPRRVLHKGKHCLVTHSPTPYCVGHLLIIPTRHICSIRDLLDSESLDVIKAQQISQEILDEVVHPHSYDIGISAGIISSELPLRHIVYHMVPRKKGDYNLMQHVNTARELRRIVRDAHSILLRQFENRASVAQTNANMIL